ncbi:MULTISPECIES: class I SAM-dependent DNA methyltransferase [Xanthomonas]|uniref:class I SAM-dependent DNA methyltransferase n=1 Tax=Xanthomonas euroxanthea TaxID=2259622 RepID=UPI0016111095|nr:N-6 DNA methylase [Xanthomonas euroxanthea]MCC4613166.1 N-6 DNA methylase [Xanthomonas campestris pv. esculenti]CAG2086366.1 N-6 DNA methylase [Xanthomonas euroxanthea]
MNLSSTIKSIQDIMRKDDGVDGDAQRLGQLTWMLFLKVFDQREEEWEDYKAEYKSPIPRPMRWRNWAAYVAGENGKKKPQIAASEIIGFVNNELFPKLKELDASASPQHKVIRSVFEDANNYMKSGTLLLAVVEKLEEAINFHDFKTRANLGDVYEQLLNDLRGAGNAGEFYTPRAITQFMADRLNPSLAKRETVMDPACGTGGFLTAAIDHLRNQLTAKSSAADKAAIEDLIRGIEKKQLPHLLCTTNMLLHGIDVPSRIEHRNTLGVGWNEWSATDKVDCVITNPPFGGYEDDGVGSDYPADLRTRETADMFVALIVKKLLKENGRAAVVLPDGFLFGDGIKATLKKLLLRDCKLHTIVRLPKGVFAPYTTIKTNLLFFTKGATVDDGSEHFHTDTIWYYEHPYPSGYKSYSKTKPIRLEEFKPEQDWWDSEANDFAGRVENELAWKVDFKTRREQAETAAKPLWDRAEKIRNQAADRRRQAKYLSDSLVGRRKDKGLSELIREQAEDLQADLQQVAAAQRDYTLVLIEELRSASSVTNTNALIMSLTNSAERLRSEADTLDLQARDAQAAGDRLYWPIYNLDLKNPNAPEKESQDPDVLLDKYKTLLSQIEETENRLKSELAAALAHHFVAKDV